MSYGNWKYILIVFSFHNSVFNGISVNNTTYLVPQSEQFTWGATFDALFNGFLQLFHFRLLSSVKQSSLISNKISLFSKAELSHLKLLSSPFQYHHKLKEVFIALTDSSSANPGHHVTETQCFMCQPPTSFSAFSTKIWRYFASFTSNQGLVMRSFLLCFFFFFPFFSLFDVWVFASDLTVSTRGDESLLLYFFFLCLMFR